MSVSIENVSPPVLRPLRGVVIAEDDEAMRSFLASTVRRWGYAVEEISGGVEMAAWLEAVSRGADVSLPSLIISGVCLPGTTLIDTLFEIRRRIEGIPVVLLTTLESSSTCLAAARMGAAAVFDKPFNTEALRRFLAASLMPA